MTERLSQKAVRRETRRKRTDKGTTLPPISGSSGTRGSFRRSSLTRVEIRRRLTLSQETVLLRFLGHAVIPTICEISVRMPHR